MAALSPAKIPGRGSLLEAGRDGPTARGGGHGAGQGSGACIISVVAHTRVRNGRTEQVGGYQRSNPDCGDPGQGGVVLATERAAPRPAAPEARPARAWEGQPNQSWREQIAAEETRRSDGDFGYGMRGQPGSSALGRYQLLRLPLMDAGWRHPTTGAWLPRAVTAGVTSDAEFLANPAAQEAALNDVMRRNEEQLKAHGAMRFLGRQLPGLSGDPVPITAAGLAAAAHREGASAVRAYLAHREANLPPPASISGRGNLSRFNEIERRLRAFAGTPYQAVSR